MCIRDSSVAIGAFAGTSAQAGNSIIINATGADLPSVNSGFYVAPVRNDTANIANIAFYNASTYEVTYANTISLSGNISGNYITANAAVGTTSSTANSLGYLGTPINTQASTYTLVIGDQGATIYAAGNITIPANGTTAFPVGTIINIIASAGITVAITSDTLQWGGQGSSQTGTRTLAQYAMATLVKVSSTTWYISGAGVT